MGRGGRNSQPPGHQIPDNRGDQRGYDDIYPVVQQGWVRDAAADFFGNACEHQRPDKVHRSRHNNGRPGPERPRGDRSGDGISRIVKPVDEIESQREKDNKTQHK
ncbi:hypothetical protein D3C75_702590 [compost metagenome]